MLLSIHIVFKSFPGSTSSEESACQCRRLKRHGFHPWVRKIPWRGKWQPTPVFLPGESHGQKNLVGFSPWDHKEWTQLSNWAPLRSFQIVVIIDYGDFFSPPFYHVYMFLYCISIIACLNVFIFLNTDRLLYSFWFTIGPLLSRSLTLVVGLLLKKSRQEGILNKEVVIRNFNKNVNKCTFT